MVPFYSHDNDFERALARFGDKVSMVCAMEIANKIEVEVAYQQIKEELKQLKKIRKKHRLDGDDE